MNDNTRNEFASYGLEILKRSVLLVLYKQHLQALQHGHFGGPDLSMKQIRTQLDLAHVGVNNDLVKGVLKYLEAEGVEGYVEELRVYGGRWRITPEGVNFIEG